MQEHEDDIRLRTDTKAVPGDSIAGDGTSEFGGSFFNFVNSIVGAGIIGLPYAFHHTGFGFGICLLTLVGYITYFSVNMLVSSGHRVRGYSYEEVMEAAFGVRGVLLVVFCQFCIAFGAMLAYIVVIGDTMTELIRSFDEGNALTYRFRRPAADKSTANVFFVFHVSKVLPLCLLRDMSSL